MNLPQFDTCPALSLRSNVGKISVGLLRRTEPVSDNEGVVNEEAEIVRLDLYPPRRLAIQQGSKLHRSRASRQQIAHQELPGDARMYQPFDQQDMMSANLGIVAEKHLHDLFGAIPGGVFKPRRNEFADLQNFQL